MKYFNSKNKPAFTMLELVFVIVVLGILAAMAISRLDRDLKQEAADSILADIRYTQHLALMDDMHKFNNPLWQKAYWRIGFENCANGTGLYEYIGSDNDLEGNIDNNEAATDPANGQKMLWTGSQPCPSSGVSNIFITQKYGINTVEWKDSCSNAQYIGFDHLGRLHQGFAGAPVSGEKPDYSSYLSDVCTLKFNMIDGTNFEISIQPETGYAQIIGQPNA